EGELEIPLLPIDRWHPQATEGMPLRKIRTMWDILPLDDEVLVGDLAESWFGMVVDPVPVVNRTPIGEIVSHPAGIIFEEIRFDEVLIAGRLAWPLGGS